jgi:hypothetical protein
VLLQEEYRKCLLCTGRVCLGWLKRGDAGTESKAERDKQTDNQTERDRDRDLYVGVLVEPDTGTTKQDSDGTMREQASDDVEQVCDWQVMTVRNSW